MFYSSRMFASRAMSCWLQIPILKDLERCNGKLLPIALGSSNFPTSSISLSMYGVGSFPILIDFLFSWCVGNMLATHTSPAMNPYCCSTKVPFTLGGMAHGRFPGRRQIEILPMSVASNSPGEGLETRDVLLIFHEFSQCHSCLWTRWQLHCLAAQHGGTGLQLRYLQTGGTRRFPSN